MCRSPRVHRPLHSCFCLFSDKLSSFKDLSIVSFACQQQSSPTQRTTCGTSELKVVHNTKFANSETMTLQLLPHPKLPFSLRNTLPASLPPSMHRHASLEKCGLICLPTRIDDPSTPAPPLSVSERRMKGTHPFHTALQTMMPRTHIYVSTRQPPTTLCQERVTKRVQLLNTKL
jgi:hypothetical protein